MKIVCNNKEIQLINISTPIAQPLLCPSCQCTLQKDGAHVFCRNDECVGQGYRRLKNWIDKREIKYIGDELVQELFDNHGVKQPHQLYLLTKEQIASLPRGNGVVGTASSQIFKEIEKSREATLSEFLGSLSIKFLGRRQVEIMQSQGIDTLDKWLELTVEQLEALPGFTEGGTKANGIVDGIQKAKPIIKMLLGVGIKIIEAKSGAQNAPQNGMSICFTGSLPSGMKRSEAQALAKAAGMEVKDSVSKGLSILVIADPDSTSSKAVKARQLGVKLISENEFMEIINGSK